MNTKKDPVILQLRYLHGAAITLKENVDKKSTLKVILPLLENYNREFKKLKEICPDEVFSTGALVRHSGFMFRYIQKGNLQDSYSDLQEICHTDIFTVEDAYRESITNNSTPSRSPFEWANIHPVIKKVSKNRFEDGHIADAVEAAFKEINDIIKKRNVQIGNKELDGDSLMKNVFGINKNKASTAIFPLADISTESGQNIQLGYMEIFAGAMKGIRNPKAHANLDVDIMEGWEMIFLASHLMRMWEKYNASK